MEKAIKEQLEKLQYYGEFYAKSDIDDKIKLEELDKTGEISEFGRNFSPQVDHKYTMVISDRRSYLLGNGRGGKDFTNFLTTLEKLDNEKYLGLRESLETDPARHHIYTHRGDLLEAFDGIYDEELQSIGNNFGEVYKEVNEAFKRGEVDLTDYPDLERAFSDYELKLLDKEIWERDNNYVKFYMDNAYEYLNEKNVLLEEKRMLDAEKHKNAGADMETVNDGSLLDGLSENVSIPESEKVAGGLDKEAVDERKLYEIQDKIIENIKNNDNYKEYSCYKVNEYYSSYGLENEHGHVVVPPYSIALTSQEEPDLYGVSEYPDVKIIPSLEDNGEINLNLKISEGIAQEFRLSDLFKDIETDDIYENTQDFASFKKVENEFKVTLDNDCDYRHETTITSMQYTYEDYHHPEINETFQEVYVNDIAETNVKLDMNELSTKDFLKEPLDTFNKHSKSKKYNDILKDGRESYHDVKDMLIEEGVIDKNRYDELLEEKAEFDKNEEIARKNIEKLMEDEAKEEYKLNEETLKRLDDNNFKRSFNELTGEYTLYSTIPDKNGNEVELINYYDYDDSPAMIHHVMEDVEDFNNFKSQMDIVRMFKINDEFKDCKVNVSEIGYMESPLKVELDRGKLRNSKLTFLVDNDGDNVNLKTQINESYTTVLNMDALFDGKLSGRDLTNMNGFTRAKDNWEFTGELLFQMCDNNDMERNSEHYEFGYSDHLVKKDTFIKEEFEKACLSGEFIDKQFELFDEHSRNIKYFNTLSSAFFGDPTKVENFLVENHLIPEELVKDNEVSEQDFINAVNSVTNKKQDKGLEM